MEGLLTENISRLCRKVVSMRMGDIVISVERAIEQAQMYGHSLRREIGFLTVHSMLHLLGYDHEGDHLEALRMREKEELVLTKLGLQRDMSFVPEEDVDA